MWSPKSRKKVSLKVFLRSETQTKILGCQMENSGSQFFFKNQNEENAFAFGAPMAIYKQKKKKTTTNESNAGYIRSFIRLLNVLSQLYTFSCLYLLEKKCTRLKNCWLVLCSMFKTVNDLSFRVLSRSVKTIDRSPCSSHQATTVQYFSFTKHGGEASHCSSCETLW